MGLDSPQQPDLVEGGPATAAGGPASETAAWRGRLALAGGNTRRRNGLYSGNVTIQPPVRSLA